MAQITQQLAHLTGMLQEQARHPNPAPQAPQQGGMGEQLLVQLLMSERDRADRAADRLMEAQDPVAQIQGLSALVDLLPSVQDEGQKDVLNMALEGLGQVISANMDRKDEIAGGGPADQHNAADAQEQHGEPDHGFYVEADPSEVDEPAAAFSNVGMGQDKP